MDAPENTPEVVVAIGASAGGGRATVRVFFGGRGARGGFDGQAHITSPRLGATKNRGCWPPLLGLYPP